MDVEEMTEKVRQILELFNQSRKRYNVLHKEWIKAINNQRWEASKILRKEMEKVNLIYESYHVELLVWKVELSKINTPEKYVVITGAGYY